MAKNEPTIEELKEIISKFKNGNTNEYLYWGDNRNYKLYKTIFEETEIKEFKDGVLNTLEYAVENRAIERYDFECSSDDTIEFCSAEDVDKYSVINEKITTEDIKVIDRDTKIENMNFIIFRLSVSENGEEKYLTIVKKFYKPATAFRQAMKYAWLGDKMKKVEEDIIYLDEQVDAFEYDGKFFIINRDKFNSIFKFRDMYCKFIDDNTDIITNTNIIDSPEIFIDKCKNNGHYIKKIAKIILKKGFENLEKNKHKVKDVIEKHNLGIQIDSDNRIIFSEDKIEGILNLLLDHYVISELSDKRAVAKALEYETEE